MLTGEGGGGNCLRKLFHDVLKVVSSFPFPSRGGGEGEGGGGRGIGTVSCYSYLGERIMCQLQGTPNSRNKFKPRLRLEH